MDKLNIILQQKIVILIEDIDKKIIIKKNNKEDLNKDNKGDKIDKEDNINNIHKREEKKNIKKKKNKDINLHLMKRKKVKAREVEVGLVKNIGKNIKINIKSINMIDY